MLSEPTKNGSAFLKRASQAAGFSALLLLPDFSELTTSGIARLHTAVPLTGVAWANIFDVAIVALFTALVFAVLRRAPFWRAGKILVAVTIPLLLLRRNAFLLPFDFGTRLQIEIGAAAVVLLFVLYFMLPRAYDAIMQLGSAVLAGLGIFAVISCVQLLRYTFWQPGPQEVRTNLPARMNAHGPRIVWIVFDELAYLQTFGKRPADLNLPNFDSFRDTSTLYTDVLPAGTKTAIALPALLLGKQVTHVEYTWSNRLIVKTVDNSAWHRFDGAQSILGNAHRDGWRTAVVGWFNPYCSMLKNEVNACYWIGWDGMEGPMSPYASLATNTFLPLKVLAEKFIVPGKSKRDTDAFLIASHRASFEDLKARSLATLEHSDADFIFLHLPIPHPPAIYSRHTGKFVDSSGASYLDSLALADRTLGELMAAMEASPRWPETTVIVNGDHSWRVSLWRDNLHEWVPEDQQVSHGVFDPRPLVLVHAPAQSSPATVATPFPLLQLHDLMERQLGKEDIPDAVRAVETEASRPVVTGAHP
ncbi:MAG TPA: sulfatase-like hydrolase/transferase [Acidobacteriaceae bacterium]|nr:sulfatase-like hydrolase/transferase [Acidobacteriaceae bacterium]